MDGDQAHGDQNAYAAVSWADRVVLPVFVTALGLTVLGVPAVVILRLLRIVPSPAAWWLLVPPATVDLCSVYLHTTHLVRKGGHHGQAGVSWIYYVAFCLLGISLAWPWRAGLLAVLTIFHACCQYYVPLGVAKALGWEQVPWHDGEEGA